MTDSVHLGTQIYVPPFLKWAGGKRWLVARDFRPPDSYRRLVEPFLGSGAVFFHLRPPQALLCDINPELINLFSVVKNFPNELQALLEYHHELHTNDYYYDIRSLKPNDPVAKAARTLYLNRTCWNGLYRVNKKGEFNVPIGTKNDVVLPGEKMTRYSAVLSNADFRSQDFEATIDSCTEGDFLFVDPPYTVKHNMNGFVKYNENMFSWDDQVRLSNCLLLAEAKGVSIMVTNADHHSVRALYTEKFSYRSMQRSSVLAASAANRGQTSEAIFTANM